MLKSRIPPRPTYEELERRNKKLELELKSQNLKRKEQFKSNIKYKNIYENSPIGIELYDSRGKLIDVNQVCLEMFGVDKVDDLTGFNLFKDPNITPEVISRLKNGETIKEKTIFDFEKVKRLKLYKTTKSGIFHHSILIKALKSKKENSITGYILQVQDITEFIEQKQIGNLLKEHKRTLEKKVKKRTADLEDLNAALSVLLKKRDNDKKSTEEKIFINYQTLVLPFLQKLRIGLTKKDQCTLMEIIESNLKEVLEPFSQKLSDPMVNLTPTEIQIASMIKQGLSNKEIAQLFNNSVRTITNHRQHIRNKLNLKNKKINLRSFLSTLP